MKRIDLICGTLGAGKTTFIRHYARQLRERGERISILASDYGAISVDRQLLVDDLGDDIDVEMVTAGDWDCFVRRFRSKLVALGMGDYDHVIVEPSGVFDTDVFFDALYEEPLDRWYQIGNVICVVDAGLRELESKSQQYLLAQSAANAGAVVLSRIQLQDGYPDQAVIDERKQAAADLVHEVFERFGCDRFLPVSRFYAFDWDSADAATWDKLIHCEYARADLVKLHVAEDGSYESLFFYKVSKPLPELHQLVQEILDNSERFGKVIRIKGFVHDPRSLPDDTLASSSHTSTSQQQAWYLLNADSDGIELRPTKATKEVIILIGTKLNASELATAFGESRDVVDYSVS